MAQTNEEFLRQRFGGPQPGSPIPVGDNQQFLNQLFGGGGYTPPGPREAQDLSDMVLAGWQSSATGLAWRGENPNLTLRSDATWYERAASNVAGMAVDLPLSIAGAVVGAAAGTAVAPGAGTLVGGGAGAFAAPMGLRDALMTAYSQGHARDWGDVWEITKSALKGTGKGAVIGGLTAGAGGAAVRALAPGAGAGAKFAASTAAEYPALMAATAAVEGHMPTAQEFLDNAILLVGMKAALPAASKLRAIFAETGKRPGEVAMDALKDPELLAFIKAEQPGPVRPGEPRPTFDPIPAQYMEMALSERIAAATAGDPRNEMVSKVVRDLMKGDENLNVQELFKELPDAIKGEYLVDHDTARGILRMVENVWRGEVETQTRGVVPVPATMDVAMRKLAGGIDPHLVGAGENASQLAARSVLLGATTENLKRVSASLADKPIAEWTTMDKLRMAAAMEATQSAYVSWSGSKAEVGRALNILRQIKYNKSLMGDAEAVIGLMGKNFKGLEWNDIARMAAALKDPSQLAKFAREANKATTTEKIIEAWKAAILSGPQTHMANMMGNLGKLFVEIPETMLATSMTAVRRALKGDGMTFAEYKAKAFAPIHGIMWGWRDAGIVALEAIKGEGAHLEKADVYRHAIEGTKGKVVRLPFRALQAEDVLFRTVAERGRAYEIAVERAIKEKFKPGTREYQERVAQYTMDPVFGLEQADAISLMTDIQNAGAEAVFAQRLGPRMEQAQAAMRGHAMQFVIPFVRTPANLLSWAVQHTPVVNLLSGRWLADFKAGGAKRDRALARVMVGGAMMMTALAFTEEGLITGGGMFDPETRKTKMAAGWQPYSIKVGDKYYSYQRLEPVAKVLGMAADWHEMQQRLGDDDKVKGSMALLAMFGNATISTTYLSGLAGVFNALTDPTRYGERFFEQYASSVVPKIIGQTAMMLDPHKREVDDITDAIQSQLPFLREKLLPKRDVWGDPAKNQKLFGVLPVNVAEETKNKVKAEAMRMGLALTDVPRVLYESGPLKQSERKIELKPEQLDFAKAVSGKAAMDILGPMVASPDWDKIPDFAKEQIIKRVLQATRTTGRLSALPPDAPERVEMRQKIVDEIVRQVQSTGGN